MHIKNTDKRTVTLRNIFTLFGAIFILWTGYRLFFRFPETVDEFIAKPILWLAPLYFIQKNWLGQTVRSLKLNRSYNIIFGLFVGILYFCAYTLFSYFKFGLPTFNPAHLSLKGICLQLIIALSTGFIEEFVFRSYFLEKALIIFNDRIISNSFTTILFTLIHLPITVFVYKYPFTEALLYLSIITLSGFIYGAVYLHKKSLAASTATHAVWNFLGTMIR